MSRKLYILLLILCITPLSLLAVNISGTILYERVHPTHLGTNSSLNFSNITQEPAKQVLVEAINEQSNTVNSTYTDTQGNYFLSNLNSNSNIKIRVYAKMFKQSAWDVKVIDNVNRDSLYVIEGNLATTGFKDTVRNLVASASNKSSPPFAILGSVYQAMQKVRAIDENVQFPPLKMNWSTRNISSGTYYDGIDNIVLQGDQQGDSDEYDDHIIIHEWGHFLEQKISRADNIGGPHGTDERLDIRVAFGEGFGNALSAIVTDDPIYFDTLGRNSGWNMNIENAPHETPGWFSEASIQRILYDLYDTPRDKGDNLDLGFQPIYKTLTTGQKTTPAFTSLFSFITELKKDNPDATSRIDEVVANENIATIEDSYGSNRISNLEEDDLPLYRELTLNTTIKNVCTKNSNNQNYNKLSNHKYIRFTINENNTYPIQIKQSNGRDSDPEFTLFKTSPFENFSTQESGVAGVEKVSLALTSGDYILDIYDANKRTKACFNVSVGKVTDSETENPDISNPETNNPENTTQTVGIGLPENKFLALFMMLLILFVPLFFIRKELKI